MEAHRAMASLTPKLPAGVQTEIDDGQLLVYTRRDMLHLDADELHDRLMHWTQTRLARTLPRATATLSFRHAVPADPHADATMDLQEKWLALEPTLALELGGATEKEVAELAALVPEFLKLVEARGRPAGYRSPDVGALE